MTFRLSTLSTLTLVLLSGAVMAGPREDLLAGYASAAASANPGFAGLDPARGKALHEGHFTGGKPDTPSCTSCHALDTRKSGQTPTGKSIDPVAVSASPKRYSDPAKVEKWFKRNCNEVLGRECTPLEKGDWLSYMISQ
ncbi:MAG: DUF1924 domain-containing protein [Zoogloeaceae bacterium]|nr:DUF1924 domain-containing protein [Zoogloeaceae bacterium]